MKIIFPLVVTLLMSSLDAARDPIRLTHGPMLGHPTSSSVRVWARTSDPGEFQVLYGTEEAKLEFMLTSALLRRGWDSKKGPVV